MAAKFEIYDTKSNLILSNESKPIGGKITKYNLYDNSAGWHGQAGRLQAVFVDPQNRNTMYYSNSMDNRLRGYFFKDVLSTFLLFKPVENTLISIETGTEYAIGKLSTSYYHGGDNVKYCEIALCSTIFTPPVAGKYMTSYDTAGKPVWSLESIIKTPMLVASKLIEAPLEVIPRGGPAYYIDIPSNVPVSRAWFEIIGPFYTYRDEFISSQPRVDYYNTYSVKLVGRRLYVFLQYNVLLNTDSFPQVWHNTGYQYEYQRRFTVNIYRLPSS